jgi:hypothetical protein
METVQSVEKMLINQRYIRCYCVEYTVLIFVGLYRNQVDCTVIASCVIILMYCSKIVFLDQSTVTVVHITPTVGFLPFRGETTAVTSSKSGKSNYRFGPE